MGGGRGRVSACHRRTVGRGSVGSKRLEVPLSLLCDGHMARPRLGGWSCLGAAWALDDGTCLVQPGLLETAHMLGCGVPPCRLAPPKPAAPITLGLPGSSRQFACGRPGPLHLGPPPTLALPFPNPAHSKKKTAHCGPPSAAGLVRHARHRRSGCRRHQGRAGRVGRQDGGCGGRVSDPAAGGGCLQPSAGEGGEWSEGRVVGGA